MWFDTHAHLQSEDFAFDRAEVLRDCYAHGVGEILLPASTLEDGELSIEVIEKFSDLAAYPRLYAAQGVHPHEAAAFAADTKEKIKSLVDRRLQNGFRPTVAIGEIGLDYFYDFCDQLVQKQVFLAQIELAHELDLPIIIHAREAFADTYQILCEAHKKGLSTAHSDFPWGVIHCISASAEAAKLYRDLGFMLGFDGPLTFKNAKKPLDVLRETPLDSIVLETDAPYLAPVPYRGRRNTPAYIPAIAAKACEVLAISEPELQKLTTENARRLYRL